VIDALLVPVFAWGAVTVFLGLLRMSVLIGSLEGLSARSKPEFIREAREAWRAFRRTPLWPVDAWRWARETRVLLGRDEYGREHQTEGDDT